MGFDKWRLMLPLLLTHVWLLMHHHFSYSSNIAKGSFYGHYAIDSTTCCAATSTWTRPPAVRPPQWKVYPLC